MQGLAGSPSYAFTFSYLIDGQGCDEQHGGDVEAEDDKLRNHWYRNARGHKVMELDGLQEYPKMDEI